MKKAILFTLFLPAFANLHAQLLTLPSAINPKQWAGTRVGVTDISIHWNAPGVKGREGKIWGTPVAHYGYADLGFGTAKASPWRAGADECTRMSFSTDVMIEGKRLAAGSYGLFMLLQADSVTLIFSKNPDGWGTYFYKSEEDVLRVTVRQLKDQKESREWLTYQFSDPTERAVNVSLRWERWRIPFSVSVDLEATTVASLQRQLSGEMGFDPPSLATAASWCLNHDVNLEEALVWADRATDPGFGNNQNFTTLSTKAGLERKLGRVTDADKTMQAAIDKAGIFELHGYGRQLISDKKYDEALVIFKKNKEKNGDVWPINMGLMRGYSAVGDTKKALEYGEAALKQAPDDLNRKNLEGMVATLRAGKPIEQ